MRLCLGCDVRARLMQGGGGFMAIGFGKRSFLVSESCPVGAATTIARHSGCIVASRTFRLKNGGNKQGAVRCMSGHTV